MTVGPRCRAEDTVHLSPAVNIQGIHSPHHRLATESIALNQRTTCIISKDSHFKGQSSHSTGTLLKGYIDICLNHGTTIAAQFGPVLYSGPQGLSVVQVQLQGAMYSAAAAVRLYRRVVVRLGASSPAALPE
jgi:hypothetical protein